MSAQYLPELPEGYVWRIDRLGSQFGIYRDFDLFIGILKRDPKMKSAYTNGDDKSSSYQDRFWIVDPDHRYVKWQWFKLRKRGERFTTKWDPYRIVSQQRLTGAKPSREHVLKMAGLLADSFYREYNFKRAQSYRSSLIGTYPPKSLIDIPSEKDTK